MRFSELDRKFEKDTKVVIYGAGDNGQKVFNALKNRCEIVLWCDSNWEGIGGVVHDPKLISTLDYDYILITISNIRIIKNIKEMLFGLGCTDDQIIIANGCPDRVIEDYNDASIVLWSDDHDNLEFNRPYAVTSMICNQSFFDMPFFRFWSDKVYENFIDLIKGTNQMSDDFYSEQVVYHRKLWEFVYISQALYERNMLCEGKKGVVFGAGTECLPDLFASFGCQILATDLAAEEAVKQGWMDSAQNAGGILEKFNQYHFCDVDSFYDRVSYRNVDMNAIPDDIEGYDFCWSACALEHLGSIEKGIEFIKNSLNALKDGGVAVHTTEYNLTSNDKTIDGEGLVLFRKKDIEHLIKELESEGYYVYPMDWHVGNSVVDDFVDLPPFFHKNMHLRLIKEDYVSTSIGIIIRKRSID